MILIPHMLTKVYLGIGIYKTVRYCYKTIILIFNLKLWHVYIYCLCICYNVYCFCVARQFHQEAVQYVQVIIEVYVLLIKYIIGYRIFFKSKQFEIFEHIDITKSKNV